MAKKKERKKEPKRQRQKKLRLMMCEILTLLVGVMFRH